ncbi:MAG TPA: hypothetical protein VD815_06425 [Candidatus Saccharimonadales bacterium]|nr:hypothetical protein [Candidatus Saccharimonadales bacterium]
MDDYEIVCVMKDNYGTITRLGFKDKSIHSVFIITRLVLSEKISLCVEKNGNRVKVGVKEQSIISLSLMMRSLI